MHIQRQFYILYICELDYKATSDADSNPEMKGVDHKCDRQTDRQTDGETKQPFSDSAIYCL